MLQRGESHIKHVDSAFLREKVKGGKLRVTSDYDELRNAHALIICVPTPLGKHREPDLSYVLDTTREIAKRLRKGQVVVQTVPVSSTRVAEATKILENTYRAVNIALVNELKMVFERMGIDIWEVIEAAKTKPFGFQAFYPGPGLGGHCIPIDPYLPHLEG